MGPMEIALLMRLALDVYVAVQQHRPDLVEAIADGKGDHIDWQTGRMCSAAEVEQRVKARLGLPPDATAPEDAGPRPKA